MSTLELKELLKSKIDETNDVSILDQIIELLENRSETIENYNLDLKKSEIDILNGNTNTHNFIC